MSIPFREGAVVVTTISGPNAVLRSLAAGTRAQGGKFIVIADTKTPADFHLPDCDYHGMERQRALPFRFAKLCHEKSYTRKNIGYLVAMAAGARFIVETDDDNFPRDPFWGPRDPRVSGDQVSGRGWLNAYSYFSRTPIYPRGYPLEEVRSPSFPPPPRGTEASAHCAIQQGLADANPDVDAIYRMLFPLPVDFDPGPPLILGEGTWCPFNSQNTTTFPEAYALLYLPTFCTIRMTDIWRGFVAQRVGWTCGWNISFHAATVYQERNEHNLLRDFTDEVPGYLNNARIARALDALPLAAGPEALDENMRRCYRELIALGLIAEGEMELLEAWLADVKSLRPRP